MTDTNLADTFAAVDLGSNSFHLKIARAVHDEIHEVDRLRERVRIAAGLTEEKTLSEEALERAYAALEKFGERIRDIPAKQVRAVGTNTLRQVRNPRAVLKKASKALGHHIEIISGQEEARLIYLGVSHSLPYEDERRLVVDIGGGSTEIIIGEGFESKRRSELVHGLRFLHPPVLPCRYDYPRRNEGSGDGGPCGARGRRRPFQKLRMGNAPTALRERSSRSTRSSEKTGGARGLRRKV